jgi:hypothetical protein
MHGTLMQVPQLHLVQLGAAAANSDLRQNLVINRSMASAALPVPGNSCWRLQQRSTT